MDGNVSGKNGKVLRGSNLVHTVTLSVAMA
jgi:hypothetical protein